MSSVTPVRSQPLDVHTLTLIEWQRGMKMPFCFHFGIRVRLAKEPKDGTQEEKVEACYAAAEV